MIQFSCAQEVGSAVLENIIASFQSVMDIDHYMQVVDPLKGHLEFSGKTCSATSHSCVESVFNSNIMKYSSMILRGVYRRFREKFVKVCCR
jgi:hypothetical protein